MPIIHIHSGNIIQSSWSPISKLHACMHIYISHDYEEKNWERPNKRYVNSEEFSIKTTRLASSLVPPSPFPSPSPSSYPSPPSSLILFHFRKRALNHKNPFFFQLRRADMLRTFPYTFTIIHALGLNLTGRKNLPNSFDSFLAKRRETVSRNLDHLPPLTRFPSLLWRMIMPFPYCPAQELEPTS